MRRGFGVKTWINQLYIVKTTELFYKRYIDGRAQFIICYHHLLSSFVIMAKSNHNNAFLSAIQDAMTHCATQQQAESQKLLEMYNKLPQGHEARQAIEDMMGPEDFPHLKCMAEKHTPAVVSIFGSCCVHLRWSFASNWFEWNGCITVLETVQARDCSTSHIVYETACCWIYHNRKWKWNQWCSTDPSSTHARTPSSAILSAKRRYRADNPTGARATSLCIRYPWVHTRWTHTRCTHHFAWHHHWFLCNLLTDGCERSYLSSCGYRVCELWTTTSSRNGRHTRVFDRRVF